MAIDVGVSSEFPRYLSIDGEPAFLIGATSSGGWKPISDPSHDFVADLDRLADVVASVDSPHVRGLVRVIPYFSGHELQPWAYRAAADAYDLASFDLDWEERLRTFLDGAGRGTDRAGRGLDRKRGATRRDGAGGRRDPTPPPPRPRLTSGIHGGPGSASRSGPRLESR